MHQEVERRNQEIIKEKACPDYMARCSATKKLFSKTEAVGPSRLSNIEVANNFSVFLWWKKEYELAKFSMFEQSMLSATGCRVELR